MSFLHKNVVNVYITYELDTWWRDLNTGFKLVDCLYGGVKLSKTSDPIKYGYSDYSVEFDALSQFSWSDHSWGKNVVLFGADMNSFNHVDNKNKDILVLCEGPTQGLDDTTIIVEAKHPIYLHN